MTDRPVANLKKRILDEMTVDHENALAKNFDLAKEFVRITKEGKIEVLVKDKVTGGEMISLYLIGKLYAKEAGLSPTSDAGNNELTDELGIPLGSVLPGLKKLRDKNVIHPVKKGRNTNHSIRVNTVEKVLRGIQTKLKKHS